MTEMSEMGEYVSRLTPVDSEKYFAVYDAACSLAVIVDHMERELGVKLLIEDAKRKLRVIAGIEENDFFTRFERVG